MAVLNFPKLTKHFMANLYKQNHPKISMQKKSVNQDSEKVKNQDTNLRIQEKILENLIELQKVHTTLAERFDRLSTHLESLLNLFETTARSFAKSPGNMTAEKDKEFLDKIDKLLDQNKTLAKGLTLMEERIRERVYGAPPQRQPIPEAQEDYESSSLNRPLPKF